MDIVFVIPTHNERAVLQDAISRLLSWSLARFGEGNFAIVLSENASKDGTDIIAARLSRAYPEVVYLGSDMPGKGDALKWGMSVLDAERYVMMDADLSVDLDSVGRMLDRADADSLVIASRRMPGSEVDRPLFRRMVTATYAGLLDLVFSLGVHDAQCGCKILSRRLRDEVLPSVEDGEFFFDTELLARARSAGFRIVEVPVRWEERGPDGRGSSVRIMKTSLDFLRKLLRLKREL